jgi:CDP-6-deoxy-D-xylo-4-hexulose-3-dehydrase
VFSRIGYNLEPSEMGAAFGLVQLGRLRDNIAARQRNFARQLAFFAEYEQWFMLPRQMPDSVTGWLAFPLIIRDDAPFKRRDLQVFFERRNIQTRTVFTGNILRQPGFAKIPCRRNGAGYPNADRVMRGGMLIACHHGLNDKQLEYVHTTFQDFARQYR